jgi:phage shock protein PspC (stress-responsive transcriptional regulator)
MHKVVSFTINQRVFNIEDDAFFALKDYLDAIKKGLGTDEASFEVLNDIEASIADKFTEKLKEANRTVLTLSDVTELKNVMGNPEDISGAGEVKEEKVKPDSKEEKPPKKLYRDTDSQMVGGVCSGLASYFKIDAVLVRLIFVALIFLNGLGILLYVVLLLVMPAAKTPAQKLEMQGEAVNLAKIKSFVNEKANELKSEGVLQRTVKVLRRIVGMFLRLLLVLIGLGLLIGGIAALVGLTIGAIVLLFSGYETTLLPFSIAPVISWSIYLLFLVAIYFLAVVPLVFLVMAATTILRKKNAFSLRTSVGLLVLWVVAIGTVTSLGVKYGPVIERVVREENLREQNILLASQDYRVYGYKDFKGVDISGAYTVNIAKGENYLVEARGTDNNLDRLVVKNENGILKVASNDFWCFGSCEYARVTVNITLPNLEYLEVDGLSQVKVTDVEAGDFKVVADGIAKVTFENLAAQALTLELDGLSVVDLSGKVDRLGASLDGTSQLDTLKAPARTVNLTLNGASVARVEAGESLTVRGDGVSKVYYKGTPRLNSELRGLAKLEKM